MTSPTGRADEVQTHLLLVDDRPENLVALQTILADLEQNLVTARSGTEALRHLLAREFAVILLDVQMPGMDGFETAQVIRSRNKWSATPIIFLTAGNPNERRSFEGYRLGAVDYIYKPIVPEVLQSKVRVFVELAKKTALLRANAAKLQAEIDRRQTLEEEIRRSEASFRALIEHAPDGIMVERGGRFVYVNPESVVSLGYDAEDELMGRSVLDVVPREHQDAFAAHLNDVAAASVGRRRLEQSMIRKDGGRVDAELSMLPITYHGNPSVLLIFRDVTERNRMQAELLELARTDHLTGLMVRSAGEQAIRREAALAQRHATPLSCVLVDIDHFKRVNDHHGHAAGDMVLQAVGTIVRSAVRECDLAIRWGGEEVLIVLPQTRLAGALACGERLRRGVESTTFPQVGAVTISGGAAEADAGSGIDAAIARADARLYAAKAAGRNRIL